MNNLVALAIGAAGHGARGIGGNQGTGANESACSSGTRAL